MNYQHVRKPSSTSKTSKSQNSLPVPQPEVSLEPEPKERDKADPLPDAAEPVPDWESSYREWSVNSLEAQWLALLPLSSGLLSWRQKSKQTHPWKLHLSLKKEVHAFTEFDTCWLSSRINSIGLAFLALKMNGGLELRITLFMRESNKHLDSSLLVSAVDPSPLGQDIVLLH